MVDTYNTQDDALEATELDPFKFTWCEEINNSESRRFIVGYHFDLIYWYESKQKRGEALKVHEYIYHDRPIRLFYDLDASTLEMTRDAFNKEIVKLKTNDDAVELDSSRKSKHSMHLIFPNIIYDDMEALRDSIKTESPVVDFKVYNSTRSLRLPFSTSNRGNPPPMGGFTYSREILMAGLLHYCPNHKSNRNAIAKNWRDENFNKILSRANPICKYILLWANKNKFQVIGSIKEGDGKIGLILRGVPCDYIKRPHKSHNTYLTIYLPSEVEMKQEIYSSPSRYNCPDVDCLGCSWNGPNFSTVLFREEILKSLRPLLAP